MKMAFVCNGSSIRAQLAAAVAREFFPEAEISAAGSLEETANPEALAVLEEDELSLEGIALKTLFDLDFNLDYAVVVGCDEGGCPLVFANKVIEWDFIPNPQGQGVEVYREAKNQLKEELKKLYLEMQ